MVIPVGGNCESYATQVSPMMFSFSELSVSVVIHKKSTSQIQTKCLCSHQVVRQFRDGGFMADLSEDQGATLNKKIRSAQLAQYNYILGDDELQDEMFAL